MQETKEDKKIKIGQICNKTLSILLGIPITVLFVLFFIDVCVIPIMQMEFFLISVAVIVVLFAISCIVGHICLKDYKPE